MTKDNIKTLVFSKGNFTESQKLLSNHLTDIGINNQILLTDNDLSDDFKKEYDYLLQYKRGYGYWIWKPCIILQELLKLNDDDILVYIDSTDYPEEKFFQYVLNHFDNSNDYLLFNRGFNHGQWTKRDCFVLMNCDNEKYYNHIQLEAGNICLKKTDFNIKLVGEWFDYCKNEQIVTDSPNICNLPNLNNFIEHRHDQSILTNLAIKYNMDSVYLDENFIKYNYNQPKIY